MPTANALLIGLSATLALVVLFLAPALGLGAPSAVLLAALSVPLSWALVHESIHGNLAPSTGMNRLLGRLLCWSLGFSWDVVCFGHLMHHRRNRHEFDRPEQLKPGVAWARAAVPYYAKLLGGHAAISALATPVMAFLPKLAPRLAPQSEDGSARMKAAASHYFLRSSRRLRVRGDTAIVLLFLVLAVFCWRHHLPILFAILAVRWMVLSLLDNMPHYGTDLSGEFEGHNMQAPRFLRWLLLNQNFHGLHHRIPALRWFELPAHFDALGEGYSTAWFGALLVQFRGPTRLVPRELAAGE